MLRHDAADILEQLQRKRIQSGVFRIVLINALLQIMYTTLSAAKFSESENKKQMNGGSGLSPSAKWSYAKGISVSASICITSSYVILLPPDLDNAFRSMTAGRAVIRITMTILAPPGSVVNGNADHRNPKSDHE